MKKKYIQPIIVVTVIGIESGIASTSDAQFNFQGNNSISPEMEDWTDNSENLNDFSADKWF